MSLAGPFVWARGTDIVGAAEFVTERLWHNAGATCIHPASGESVG